MSSIRPNKHICFEQEIVSPVPVLLSHEAITGLITQASERGLKHILLNPNHLNERFVIGCRRQQE